MEKTVLLLLAAMLLGLATGQMEETKTCKYKNNGEEYEVAEGEVTEIKKTKIRVCENGKTVLKKKEEVPFPYKIACGGETGEWSMLRVDDVSTVLRLPVVREDSLQRHHHTGQQSHGPMVPTIFWRPLNAVHLLVLLHV
jgi:hypothetical protein